MWDGLRRWRMCLAIAACLPVLLTLTPGRVMAQGKSGTIAGVVLDPDGKAVAEAGIIVRNEASGDVRTAVTGGNGRFSVADLAAGSYTVEVGVPGFDIIRKTGVHA